MIFMFFPMFLFALTAMPQAFVVSLTCFHWVTCIIYAYAVMLHYYRTLQTTLHLCGSHYCNRSAFHQWLLHDFCLSCLHMDHLHAWLNSTHFRNLQHLYVFGLQLCNFFSRSDILGKAITHHQERWTLMMGKWYTSNFGLVKINTQL